MREDQDAIEQAGASQEALADMVAASDTGARIVAGPVGKLIAVVALCWSLFQLWTASKLPFMFADVIPLLNDTHTRSAHLAFAVFLAFLSYPALKGSPRDRVPWQDWLLAILAASGALYLAVFANQIAERPGLPTTADLVMSGIGLVFLLEAARRALGLPLTIVALVFLAYIFFGEHAPEIIAWKGASFGKAMSHLWITQEGVFGIGIGVSASFIFLFVLFGALLEKAGAGNYFTKVAFSLLGHYRGGPAKAAVVSSAMTGLISGSSIANVVTTGTFTIPLMKRVGFSAEKAGAVEVASSTNGQLTPPIMGAAAFLMIEFVGISYVEVIKHAFLPAIISYIALVYIVHLEALKADMKGLPRRTEASWLRSLIATLMTAIGVVVLSAVVFYGFGWVKVAVPEASFAIAIAVIIVAYVALVWYAARTADLEMDDPNAAVLEMPEPGPTIRAGLHYLLPVVVLVWCLTVERFSPGLAAFWASILMIAIVITQHPLKAFFRGTGAFGPQFRHGWDTLIEGLIAGARNMIGIGVAVAVAGIIVGAVTLTGIGLVMTEFVEFISGGNLILMLIFTAGMSLVLGLGLPTTANYIVVSSLMANVVLTLGAQSGLIVPLIAVHMFVFYFGILADDTPPVGLAAFAAAAISQGDPIRTGLQGFMYDIRTAILPFMFIFNTQLLLIGIDHWWDLPLTIASAVVAMLVFAAGTQGYFLVKSRLWESLALILIAFTLFRPGFWLDFIEAPYERTDPARIEALAEAMPADASLRVLVSGIVLADDKEVSKTVMLPLGPPAAGAARLNHAGIDVRLEDGKTLIDNIVFGSAAERAGVDFDWRIVTVQLPVERMPKQLMFIPALVLLGLVVLLQRGRRARARPAVA